ncbi:MAG: hypothetical protein O7G86_08960, partial [Gammaproteobacteria bacterium]|nr:hypothetical protein [Gammaproteobacteria bacterium]
MTGPLEASQSEIVEEIVVTGSHIKRTDLEGPMPVVVFNSDDLYNSGVNTLGEFARYLPFNALTDNDAEALSGSKRGTAQFNLRGIGL